MSQTLDRSRPHHPPENIDRGLHALALAGSSTQASEACGIPARTLLNWKTAHADRYQEIRAQVMPRIHAQMATEAEDLARTYAKLEAKALEDIQTDWDHLKPQDKIAATRNWTVSRGISTDKAMLLRNRPTAIVEHRTPEELHRELAQHGVQVIDGTATEIQDPPALPAV